MATINPDVLAKIQKAEDDLAAARVSDDTLAQKAQAVAASQADQATAQTAANDAHATANQSATDALAALKAELGIG